MKAPLSLTALLLFTFTCLFQNACSSSSPSSSPSTANANQASPDAGTGEPTPVIVASPDDGGTAVDSGPVVPISFPAPHPDPRQLTKLNGEVLAHPHVVPLFFADDPDRAQTEAILAQLPGSPYWAGLKEYGVLDITIEPSVVIGPTAPTTYSLDDIETTVHKSMPSSFRRRRT